MGIDSSATPAKASVYNHLKSGDGFKDLKAKSRLHRMGLIHAELDITHTIATFGDPRRHSNKLLQARRRAARKGYELVTKLLSECGLLDELGTLIDAKVNRLRVELSDLDNGLPSDPSIPWPDVESAPAEPSPNSPAGNIVLGTLTKREREVLRQIALGHSTKATARLMGITFKTAACHRYRIMDKLDIHDTATLVRFAIRNGIVQA